MTPLIFGHRPATPAEAAEFRLDCRKPRPGRLRLDGDWLEAYVGIWVGIGPISDPATGDLVPIESREEYAALVAWHEGRAIGCK